MRSNTHNIYKTMTKTKYQYIVITKWFYLSNGADVAGATDKRDIRLFSTLKKAKEFVEWSMSEIKQMVNTIDFTYYEEVTSRENARTIKTYNYVQPTYEQGFASRYGFSILKQVVE